MNRTEIDVVRRLVSIIRSGPEGHDKFTQEERSFLWDMIQLHRRRKATTDRAHDWLRLMAIRVLGEAHELVAAMKKTTKRKVGTHHATTDTGQNEVPGARRAPASSASMRRPRVRRP